jgi:general secretion pathway protein A
MYCPFYGFSEKPFEVTPDPKYLYLSPSHREMLAALVYGIKERRGFIAIIGEVGTGKTTLLNALLDRLDEHTKVAYICNTSMDFEQILRQVLLELGLQESGVPLSKFKSIQWLNDLAIGHLSRGGNVVLIVDEAQNLDHDSLENLRLLSNLETRKHKLIQIVLSGQPELDAKLRRPELRQLAQRISVRRHIEPLAEVETCEYIRNRLALVGYKGSALFDREAEQLIYSHSGGIPRKINILCDNALLIGYGLGQKRIKAEVVEEAAKDLGWSSASSAPPDPSETPVATPMPVVPVVPEPRTIGLGTVFAAMFVFTACLTIGVWGFLTYSGYSLKLEERVVVRQPIQQGPETNQSSVVLPPSNNFQTSPAEERDVGRDAIASTGQQAVVNPAVPPLVEPAVPAPQTDVAPVQVQTQKTENQSIESVKAVPSISRPEPKEAAGPASVTPRTVTVGYGDTLFDIIQKAYGRYDQRLLNAVLENNPHLLNPDRILAGQVIQLPEPVEKAR